MCRCRIGLGHQTHLSSKGLSATEVRGTSISYLILVKTVASFFHLLHKDYERTKKVKNAHIIDN